MARLRALPVLRRDGQMGWPVFPAAFAGKTHAVKTAAADRQLLIVPEWSLS
jgi:hypothetical protein